MMQKSFSLLVSQCVPRDVPRTTISTEIIAARNEQDKLDRWCWNDEMNSREEANKFPLKRDVLASPVFAQR